MARLSMEIQAANTDTLPCYAHPVLAMQDEEVSTSKANSPTRRSPGVHFLLSLTDDAPFQDPIPVSPPYFAGRFSNRPVWVERLTEMLDLNVR